MVTIAAALVVAPGGCWSSKMFVDFTNVAIGESDVRPSECGWTLEERRQLTPPPLSDIVTELVELSVSE